MIKWTEKELITNGYTVENARITSVDLSMADHGCLTLALGLEGRGWGCVYGGYVLGKGYLGADDNFFSGYGPGLESIIRIMDVVGVDHFNSLKNTYVRVATKSWGDSIKIIGNIIKDKWFDQESFFEDKEKDN